MTLLAVVIIILGLLVLIFLFRYNKEFRTGAELLSLASKKTLKHTVMIFLSLTVIIC